MTVDDMRRRVSGKEYTGWYIYYAREAQQLELARKRGR